MFSKRLQELTRDDIDQVISNKVQESDQVEFKEALSGKHGADGWHTGADRIGDRARNQIVSEIVAFGNAHGGTLLLGIRESDDHPHRAKGVRSIPRCADLASRVAMFCGT
jgi:predicted HTH transcriptional regulator